LVNVVWGIRWGRDDNRGGAPRALALPTVEHALLSRETPSSPARAALAAARAVILRAQPCRLAAAPTVRQSFPPARLHGSILRLLRGVSGRQQAEDRVAHRGRGAWLSR
jgi:hypothetical protein